MVPSTHTNASKWPTPSLILMFVHFKELVCVWGGGSYGHFDKKNYVQDQIAKLGKIGL